MSAAAVLAVGALLVLCVLAIVIAKLASSDTDDAVATPTQMAVVEPTEPAPTPTPLELKQFALFEGDKEMVTDNFDVLPCTKAVFFWSVRPNEYSIASLAITLHKEGTNHSALLVNALKADSTTAPLTGEAVQPLSGASYYLSTANLTGPWEVRGVCLDGQLPAGTEIDVEDTETRVTDNFALAKCDKSVFPWSVEPDPYGTTALIVELWDVEKTSPLILVNDVKMDSEGALTGEALQPLEGGVYFLAIKAASGPWTIKWECRDQ